MKSTAPRLPISQFLPIGRRSRRAASMQAARSGAPVTRQADVDGRSPAAATRPIAEHERRSPSAVRRRGRGPGRCCAGRRRSRPLGVGRRGEGRRRSRAPSSAHGQADRQQDEADRRGPRAATSGRRGVRRRPGRASPRRARGSSGSAGGPARRVMRTDAASPASTAGHAERRWRARPTRPARPAAGRGVVGRRAGGHAVGGVARPCRPTRAGTTTSPSSSAGVVDGDGVETLADLEGDRLARARRPSASRDRRASWSRARRRTSGRWASSSNSSSASIRPWIADVARRAVGERTRLGDAGRPASTASSRPTR